MDHRVEHMKRTGPRIHGVLLAWDRFAVCVMLWSLLASCAETQDSTKQVSYMETARSNYEKGLTELQDDNYLDAIKLFSHVKNKYPFSRYATLAELRIADVYFAQEKFLEAIDAYKLFHKFHPTHPEVINGYASYRICDSYVQQMPTDWFLVPPSYEKDQAATKDALRTLVSFLKSYPQSKYLSKARDLYRQCVRRLADHELYVARFYLERDKPQATILRLETLLQNYSDAGVDPEVLLMLGQTYLKMRQPARAKDAFANLVKRYPNNPYSAKAHLYLEFIASQRE